MITRPLSRSFFLMLLLLLGWTAALSPGDFSRGLMLEPSGTAPLQAVVLPEDVYRHSQFADLRDLRVFNAANDELSFAIYPGLGVDEPERAFTEVPAYLLARNGEREDAEIRDLRERLEQVEAAESEGGLELGSLFGLSQTGVGTVIYLLDTSEVAQEIQGLRLTWGEEVESFMTTIRLESSDDLVRWEAWGDNQIVAGLRTADYLLARNEIALPTRRANFIRLLRTDSDPTTLPELQRVEVELVPDIDPETRRWWRPQLLSHDDYVYTFDMGGMPAIDSARFILAPGNVVAQVRLQSSNDAGRGFRPHYEGHIYRFQQDGEALSSLLVNFPAVSERYWRLEIIGAQLEEGGLELGQLPDTLVFVASGEAPYTLAYGSVLMGDASPRLDLSDLPPLRAGRVEIAAATAGEPFTLGGDAALVTPNTLRLRVGIGVALALAIAGLSLFQVRRMRAARKAAA